MMKTYKARAAAVVLTALLGMAFVPVPAAADDALVPDIKAHAAALQRDWKDDAEIVMSQTGDLRYIIAFHVIELEDDAPEDILAGLRKAEKEAKIAIMETFKPVSISMEGPLGAEKGDVVVRDDETGRTITSEIGSTFIPFTPKELLDVSLLDYGYDEDREAVWATVALYPN